MGKEYARAKHNSSFQSLIWSDLFISWPFPHHLKRPLTERWRNWCWPIIKCKWLRLALQCTFKYCTALIARRSFSALNYCRIMTPTLVIACKWNWLESRRSPSQNPSDFLMIVKIEFDNVQFLPFPPWWDCPELVLPFTTQGYYCWGVESCKA